MKYVNKKYIIMKYVIKKYIIMKYVFWGISTFKGVVVDIQSRVVLLEYAQKTYFIKARLLKPYKIKNSKFVYYHRSQTRRIPP